MPSDVEMQNSPATYHGRILKNDFSEELKQHLKKILPVFHAFDRTGSPAIPYISAWQGHEKNIWYEFVSRRFLDLMGCEHSQIAGVLRSSIVDRRIYKTHDTPHIEKEIAGREELNRLRGKIREESQKSDFSEAVYKLALTPEKTIWIKDQTAIVSFPEDQTSLSYGCLTVVTKEMEAEAERTRLMAEKSKLESQLQKIHQLEAIGNLAAGIAHDLGQKLMGIQQNVGIVLENLGKEQQFDANAFQHYQHLKNVEIHLKEVNSLSKQLLSFAGKGSYNFRETDLNDIVDFMVKEFRVMKTGINIDTVYEKHLRRVNADRAMIGRTILNLLDSASQPDATRSTLRVETQNIRLDRQFVAPFGNEPGDYAKIIVSNKETRLDESDQKRFFEPFYAEKEAADSGLRMASAFGIIKKHGGMITITDDAAHGTSFNIFLPASVKP